MTLCKCAHYIQGNHFLASVKNQRIDLKKCRTDCQRILNSITIFANITCFLRILGLFLHFNSLNKWIVTKNNNSRFYVFKNFPTLPKWYWDLWDQEISCAYSFNILALILPRNHRHSWLSRQFITTDFKKTYFLFQSTASIEPSPSPPSPSLSNHSSNVMMSSNHLISTNSVVGGITSVPNNSVAITNQTNNAISNGTSIKYGTLVPNRIFVGGISSTTTEADLHKLFSAFGNVKATKIISDRGGCSKGYGFVTFETEEEAKKLQTEVSQHFKSCFPVHSALPNEICVLSQKCQMWQVGKQTELGNDSIWIENIPNRP